MPWQWSSPSIRPSSPKKVYLGLEWKLKIDFTLLARPNPPLLFLKWNSVPESVHSFILLLPPSPPPSLPPSFGKVLATLLHSLILWLTCSLSLSVSSHSLALSTEDTLIHLFLHPSLHPLSSLSLSLSLFLSYLSSFPLLHFISCHLSLLSLTLQSFIDLKKRGVC